MSAHATKRIPVTEERWKQLHELKEAGQTYDDLLEELIQDRNRRELGARFRELDEMDTEELVSLDDV